MKAYAAHLLKLPAPGEASSASSVALRPSSTSYAAPVDILAASLSLGCCVRCGLRYASVSREAMYRLPYAALYTAVVELIDEYASKGVLPGRLDQSLLPGIENACVACNGLLQGRVGFGVGVNNTASKAAKISPPPSSSSANSSSASSVVTTTDDWAAELACSVAQSGYDLHGGMSVAVSIPQKVLAHDELIRARVGELLAAALVRATATYSDDKGTTANSGSSSARFLPAVGGALPSRSWALKDVVRSIAYAALGSVEVGPLLKPSAATAASSGSLFAVPSASAPRIVSAAEYQRIVASVSAAANSSSSESGGLETTSTTSIVTPPLLAVAAEGVLDNVWVDLGSGVSGMGADSTYADWDGEGYGPAKALLAALKPAATASSSSSSSAAGTGAGDNSCSITASSGGYTPLRLSQQSSLQLTVSVDPPSDAALSAVAASVASRVKALKDGSGGSVAATSAATSVSEGAVATSSVSPAAAAVAEAAHAEAVLPPPRPLSPPIRLVSTLERGSLFLKCRYNKYARGLSQTKWILEGKR